MNVIRPTRGNITLFGEEMSPKLRWLGLAGLAVVTGVLVAGAAAAFERRDITT